MSGLPPTSPCTEQSSATNSSVTKHAATLSLLAVGAIWGTLTRLGLVALNTYDGQSVFALLWAQSIGCLIMGWASASVKPIESRYPPLLIGMTTGYCGSLTTFSSFILSVVNTNFSHFDRNGLDSFLDAVVQTILTLVVCLTSFDFGATYLHESLPVWKIFFGWFEFSMKRMSSPESNPGYDIIKRHNFELDLLFIVSGTLHYVGTVLMFVYFPNSDYRDVIFPCLLGPPGAWLRWYLSKLNVYATPYDSEEKRYYSIPLGTFLANVSAVVVLSGVDTLGTLSIPEKTIFECQLLRAVSQGFCGCLSTVSTFIGEVKKLTKRRSWFYLAVSYWVAIIFCVVIVGAPRWSGRNWGAKCSGKVNI